MPSLLYYYTGFPFLTHTLANHQVRATQELGLDFWLAANRPPPPDHFNPEFEDLLSRTTYLMPVRPLRYCQSNLKILAQNPKLYLKALNMAAELRHGDPWQIFSNLAHVAGAAVLAESLQKHPVCHAHLHFAYGNVDVAMFLETLSGLPFSVSIHGSDVLLPNPLLEEKLGRARFIISNCRFHIQNLRSKYPSLKAQRFYIVSGGLDLSSKPWNNICPAEASLPMRILMVTRLVPVKAPEILVQACSRLLQQKIPFHCRIVGDGPERPMVERLIQATGLQDHIELLGFRSQDEVARLYDWSQVVALSSRSEGTPMVIIEAMAKGRPMVAPNITGIPEMVVDGETGYLFPVGSPEALAEKLAKFAANSDLISKMGERARQHAQENFDLRTSAVKFFAILAQEVPALGLKSDLQVAYE